MGDFGASHWSTYNLWLLATSKHYRPSGTLSPALLPPPTYPELAQAEACQLEAVHFTMSFPQLMLQSFHDARLFTAVCTPIAGTSVPEDNH